MLGVEMWQADLLEARFLPPLESSLDKIPEGDVAELIDAAAKTGKRVYLLTARGGIVGLRGARAWQKRNQIQRPRRRTAAAPQPLRRPAGAGQGSRISFDHGADTPAGVHLSARAIAVALAPGGDAEGTGEGRLKGVHARAHRRARPVLFPPRRHRDRAGRGPAPRANAGRRRPDSE